ncbi:MAG: polyphosphate kinase [Lewinellaceae bacterium]|nr:polyphosphate kinase [Lewinellaceae bacterium]HPR00374.1 polyphosphate kinase [Saprospiraceae bacterium]HQU54586.1 polyphosphate kinase [Saprospiraceae bacterium]
MIDLSQIPTTAPEGVKKKQVRKETRRLAKRLAELQYLLFAEKKHGVLVVFQGMDTSGKDGATRNAFQYCSPSGMGCYSFKKPTDLEFAHDFLWRVQQHSPAKGDIQIFIRSHYEDILIQRVHSWINEDRVKSRMDAINAYETNLASDNNTLVIKFYMHLSRERQAEKLQERLDDPSKQWKHNADDWKEAELWDQYRKCYEDAINWSTIPWHIIPVDQRWYRNFLITKILVERLEALQMQLPLLPKS